MHRHEVIGPPSKVFVVPVCEEHQHSDEWEWRYRSVFACLTGISASALVFGTMAGFHEARLSGVLPLWYIALLMGFIFLLSGTMIAFGKKPIEKAIDFLGFTYDEKSVLVSIGNDTYRRLLLEQNPSAELVNWVVFL
ncbi:MAG: hypothetical protein HXY34_03710 [Candidatus Thorarchaeota archaeon]|nr:hypothetical protein [Candidatus Thorarchaeota archaeon]